jgi:3,4-dihydroxy 2-butanone 4-phosphate synthase/GTP cyclohydrolase II
VNSIEEIIAEIRAGRMVVMMDDETRENEADLIMAAEAVTAEAVAFFVRYTSGIICQPMLGERLQELSLPQMVPENTESHRTAFTISVDYRLTTTGIPARSRQDHSRSAIQVPARVSRARHIFRCGTAHGVPVAPDTPATVDLVRLAVIRRSPDLCEIVNDDGTMKRGGELEKFAGTHGLKVGTIADLIRHRLRNERSVERISDQQVATDYGEFRMCCYEDYVHRDVHIALVRGSLDGLRPPLVRVHVADTVRDLIGFTAIAAGRPGTRCGALPRRHGVMIQASRNPPD